MKPEEIKKIYSKLAKDYDKIVLKKVKYTAHRKIGKWVIKELKTKKAKILDLGCGTGLSSLEFFKKGYEVTGIDIAPGMVKQAKKLPFRRLICQNLEARLKVKKEEYDVVVLVGVMEFIKRPVRLFKEINQKLKRKGIVALTVPKKMPKSSKLNIHSYSKKEIEQVFKNAGFKVVGYKDVFGYKKRDEVVSYHGYVLRKKNQKSR